MKLKRNVRRELENSQLILKGIQIFAADVMMKSKRMSVVDVLQEDLT